jgi:hypothetical protein
VPFNGPKLKLVLRETDQVGDRVLQFLGKFGRALPGGIAAFSRSRLRLLAVYTEPAARASMAANPNLNRNAERHISRLAKIARPAIMLSELIDCSKRAHKQPERSEIQSPTALVDIPARKQSIRHGSTSSGVDKAIRRRCRYMGGANGK